MDYPLVVNVILNTNRRQDTLDCLTSLAASTYPNHRSIVLDNQSTDGSVAAIQAEFPTVHIISLTSNRGYAGNNNVGIEAALGIGADWVVVLNEDTVVEAACLDYLVTAGESDPQIGIVGPMVYHHDEPGVIQSAGGLLGPTWESIHVGKDEPDHGQFQELRQVEWISGCGILVRRSVIEQVGMIDPRFYYYWEETEWCVRAGRAGWKVMHVPQAKLWHKGVQRDHRPKPSVTYYNTRNRLLLLAKHRAPLTAWLHTWTQIARTLTSWTVRPKWRSMREHRAAMLSGVRDFLQQRWGPMPS